MAQKDINRLIEGYFDATLSEQEESQLRQLLVQTKDDSEDILHAKATLSLFAINRKIEGKKNGEQNFRTRWGKIKYAAVFAIGVLFDIFFDFDDFTDKRISK